MPCATGSRVAGLHVLPVVVDAHAKHILRTGVRVPLSVVLVAHMQEDRVSELVAKHAPDSSEVRFVHLRRYADEVSGARRSAVGVRPRTLSPTTQSGLRGVAHTHTEAGKTLLNDVQKLTKSTVDSAHGTASFTWNPNFSNPRAI